MIKWIIIGLLVAGSFGVIWTAPWKDDVDRATDRVRGALSTLDQNTNRKCSDYGRQVPQSVKDAVAEVEREGARDAELADRARRQADGIAECVRQLPALAPEWGDIERRLRGASPTP